MERGWMVTPTVRLVRLLGQGGMGSVWVADHLALGTQVAVKFVAEKLEANDRAKQRFAREAIAASQVKSPHIVQVFDQGIAEGGVPYIVMELLEGSDLGRYIAMGSLPLPWIASVVTQACKGLGRAHAVGVLHRDVKPENLFVVDQDGEPFVKLLDFGVAKETSRSLPTSMTSTGAVIGTPYYMSPEQMRGAREAEPRSDLWSLGVTAYHALTGALPFSGDSMAALYLSIARAEFTPPSARCGSPPQVDAWFAKALAREASARFQTAREMGEALREAVGHARAPDEISAFVPTPRPAMNAGPTQAVATRSIERAASPLATAPVVSTPPAAIDADFEERFTTERFIARGGMGSVYRAGDARSGLAVALKVLGSDARPSQVARFDAEAALLASVTHPAIVRYVAHGKNPKGERWLAMEWLEGEDLSVHLARLRAHGGGDRELSAREICQITESIAGALATLHRRGLMHLDVKPGNIYLQASDPARAKLLDFGIARYEAKSAVQPTAALVGTPLYMSPEQARGIELDRKTDVWSLGVVLYELLAGAPPFAGDTMVAVLAKIVLEPLPSFPAKARRAPQGLLDLAIAMLDKDPVARPSADDVALSCARLSSAGFVDDAGTPDELPVAGGRALGEGERRLRATLLTSRISGSTDEVEAALAPFGATFDVLADRSVLVTLPQQPLATDEAVRAVRAAKALVAAVPSLSTVVVSARGTTGGAPLGAVIDRAAAALASAVEGSVLADTLTGELLEGRLVVTRGEGGRLVGDELADPTRRVLGRATPWVGREREIAVVDGLFEGCVDEPRATAALVKAPAGSGKSRFRYETIRRLSQRTPSPRVLAGAADALTSGAPLAMLTTALRSHLGIVEADPPAVRRDKVTAAVTTLGAPDATHVSHFIGELVGAQFEGDARLRAARSDPMLMSESTKAAFLALLDAETARGPVVLVLEDLHWGDGPTVAFVDAALRTLASRPLFVLALARPEVDLAFPALWKGRELHELRLAALPKRAAEHLARVLLGDAATDGVVSTIVTRAEGNAFLLEELVRAFATGATDVPDTLLGMLQARLDALGPEAKRVLRAASVLGESFDVVGVARLVETKPDDPSLVECLAELVRREALVDGGGGATTYAFRHALVRDAAYAMLTDDDRTRGHRVAAEVLAGRADANAVAVAEHHLRGGDPVGAIRWLRRGAEDALDASDLEKVVELSARAVDAGAEGEERGALLGLQASASYWSSAYETACLRGREAALLLPEGSIGWYRVVADTIVASARRGRPDDVVAWVARALDADAERDARDAQVICLCRGTFQLVFAGAFARADELIARIRGIAPDVDAEGPVVAAQISHLLGVRAAHAADVGGFLVHLERAIEFFVRAGDARNAALERPTLGWCYAELGDPARATEILTEAVATCERLGVTQPITYALVNLGYALALGGDAPRARDVLLDAATRCQAQKNPRLEGWARVHLSTVFLGTGDATSAASEAASAVGLLAASPGLSAWAHAAWARAALALGDVATAESASATGAEILARLGSILQCESLVPLVRAEVLVALGRNEEARTVVGNAATRLRARADALTDARHRAGFLSLADSRATLALEGLLSAAG